METFLSVLLTPVTFGLAVATAWVLRKLIRDIVKTTGLIELGITKEGAVSAKFDPQAFAEKAYRKQRMNSPSPDDVEEIASLVQSFRPFVAGRRILWVDNHPENNRLERAGFVTWGVDVQSRRNTEGAMEELSDVKDTPFDLVISDWFRNGEPEGERLAEMMRSAEIDVPIIFYFTADNGLFSQISESARKRHAVGATSSPRELLRWTFAELVRATLRDKRVLITLPDSSGQKIAMNTD
jgi:CheY-like chemotaxis protein